MVLTASQAAADVRLMMIEELGCPYCDLWKSQIGPIYPKTPEGRIAPLTMVMIHDPLEDGITLKSKPIYTPTFVLLNDGQEISRIEGYPGEDLFWWRVEMMLKALPEDLQKDPGT